MLNIETNCIYCNKPVKGILYIESNLETKLLIKCCKKYSVDITTKDIKNIKELNNPIVLIKDYFSYLGIEDDIKSLWIDLAFYTKTHGKYYNPLFKNKVKVEELTLGMLCFKLPSDMRLLRGVVVTQEGKNIDLIIDIKEITYDNITKEDIKKLLYIGLEEMKNNNHLKDYKFVNCSKGILY